MKISSCSKRAWLAALAMLAGIPGFVSAQGHPARGLWVGEAVISNVNEVVVGINAANQVAAPDPNVATPVATPASIRLLLHVDGQGQVRLLKSVAVLDKSTNQSGVVALVTDENLYPNFANPGRRLSAAAFDFGDANSVDALNQMVEDASAAAAGNAASGVSVAGLAATNAAGSVAYRADLDARYQDFARSTVFNRAPGGAAGAATAAAVARKNAGGTAGQVLADATSAATNNAFVQAAMTDAVARQSAALFGDTRYVNSVNAVSLGAAAAAAAAANSNATAAAVGTVSTNAAQAAAAAALTAPSPVSPGYRTFIASSTFQNSTGLVASVAASAAVAAHGTGASTETVQNRASSAALKALAEAGVLAAADLVPLLEARMDGQFTPGGGVSGQLYLGAYHPTNPFRHRRHPDHTAGYAVRRNVNLQFNTAPGTNTFERAGYGVDRISGIYGEELFGLHKPLGPARDIGLKAAGGFTLNRVSLVDVLNQ